jgi:hypothetical protein
LARLEQNAVRDIETLRLQLQTLKMEKLLANALAPEKENRKVLLLLL